MGRSEVSCGASLKVKSGTIVDGIDVAGFDPHLRGRGDGRPPVVFCGGIRLFRTAQPSQPLVHYGADGSAVDGGGKGFWQEVR